MSVALVHDYLTQRGGAERVALALTRAFPGAPLHTSLYQPSTTFDEFDAVDVRAMPIDRLGPLRRDHRLALPLLAPSFSATSIDADLVVCSSSGWAHGVRTHGRKVVYCHAPARWLYQRDRYVAESGRSTRLALTALAPFLRRWDQQAARSADDYVVNSARTRDLVRDAYGIDAPIVHPPHGVDADGARTPIAGIDPGFVLCVSRLLAYKNVDAVIAATAARGDRLVMVGRGPDAARLRALAGPEVRFIESASDPQLRWLYAEARVLVAASYEDFGLTPIEAAAFGTPAVTLRFGGYLETVVDGETGTFFDSLDPAAIATAIERLDRDPASPDALRRQAERFSPTAFLVAIRSAVDAT